MPEDESDHIDNMNGELSYEFTKWLRKKYGKSASGHIRAHPSMNGIEPNEASWSAVIPQGRGKKPVRVTGEFEFAPNSYGADAAEVMEIPYGQIEGFIRDELE